MGQSPIEELTEENKKQFYISEGFAYGFLVFSASTAGYTLADGTPLNLSQKDENWDVLENTFRFTE